METKKERKKERNKERKKDFFYGRNKWCTMYQFNGRKMNEWINIFCYIQWKKDFINTKMLIFFQEYHGSSGSGDKQQRVIAVSIPACARPILFFTQYIAGKFPKC